MLLHCFLLWALETVLLAVARSPSDDANVVSVSENLFEILSPLPIEEHYSSQPDIESQVALTQNDNIAGAVLSLVMDTEAEKITETEELFLAAISSTLTEKAPDRNYQSNVFGPVKDDRPIVDSEDGAVGTAELRVVDNKVETLGPENGDDESRLFGTLPALISDPVLEVPPPINEEVLDAPGLHVMAEGAAGGIRPFDEEAVLTSNGTSGGTILSGIGIFTLLSASMFAIFRWQTQRRHPYDIFAERRGLIRWGPSTASGALPASPGAGWNVFGRSRVSQGYMPVV